MPRAERPTEGVLVDTWRDLIPSREGRKEVEVAVLAIVMCLFTHVIGGPWGVWLLAFVALVLAWSTAVTSDLYRAADRLAREAIDHTGEVIQLWKRDVERIQRKEASWRN